MSIFRFFSLLACLLLCAADGHCRGIHRYCEHKKDIPVAIRCVTIKRLNESDFKTLADYFGSKNSRQYFRCTAVDDDSRRAETYLLSDSTDP